MRWIIGIVVVALIAWGISKFAFNDTEKEVKVNAVKVSVAPVVRQSVPLTVELAGNVIAYETVEVKSRMDSQINQVTFADGDYVQEEQILFKLDDRTVRAQINELQAAVQKEKAQLENTRLQYERARKLVDMQVVSRAQLDNTKAAYEAQLAAVNAAQASYDNAKVLLTYTEIRAPISGRAGTIHVTQGNNVQANDTEPLVTINQVSPIRVQFAIPERYYEPVKTAMEHEIPIRAIRKEAGEQSEGKLEYIDNTIDPTTGTFTARGIFANEEEALWPGMFVTVDMKFGELNDVLTIPAVAVQGDEGNQFVFKAVEGKALKTPVEITHNTGDIAVVSHGLSEGDHVLVDGLLRVTDGSAIEASDVTTPNADTAPTANP